MLHPHFIIGKRPGPSINQIGVVDVEGGAFGEKSSRQELRFCKLIFSGSGVGTLEGWPYLSSQGEGLLPEHGSHILRSRNAKVIGLEGQAECVQAWKSAVAGGTTESISACEEGSCTAWHSGPGEQKKAGKKA